MFNSQTRSISSGPVPVAGASVMRPLPEKLGDFLTIQDLGGKGDGSNEREMLRTAVAQAAALNKQLVIDIPLYVQIDDDQPSQPIELLSGTDIAFRGNGSITLKSDRLPLFFAVNKKCISVKDALFYFDGQHDPTFNQSYAMTFHNSRIKGIFPTADWMGPASYQNVFFLIGCEDLYFDRPKFISKSSDSDKLFVMCFLFYQSSSATRGKNIHVTDPFFDGVYMSILCGNCDGLYFRNVVSHRYGTMLVSDTASTNDSSGWFPPPHVIYNSGASSNFVIDGLYDAGINCGGGNWGQTSVKVRDVSGFYIANITSLRDYGLMDFSGRWGTISNLKWRGDGTKASAGSLGTNPFRWLATSFHQEEVHINGLHLYDTSTRADRTLSLASSATSQLNHCTMRNVRIVQEAWGLDGVTPYFYYQGRSNSFEISIELRTPHPGTDQAFLFREDSAAGTTGNNVWRGELIGFQNATIRNQGGGFGDRAEFIDVTGDAIITQSSGTTRKVGKKRINLTATAGATVLTATGIIPAGSVVTGVSASVITPLGATGGLTGFKVGISGSDSRYGTRTGTTGSTTNANWTDATVANFAAATNIIITALAGTFDGTGDIDLTVEYIQSSQGTSTR